MRSRVAVGLSTEHVCSLRGVALTSHGKEGIFQNRNRKQKTRLEFQCKIGCKSMACARNQHGPPDTMACRQSIGHKWPSQYQHNDSQMMSATLIGTFITALSCFPTFRRAIWCHFRAAKAMKKLNTNRPQCFKHHLY